MCEYLIKKEYPVHVQMMKNIRGEKSRTGGWEWRFETYETYPIMALGLIQMWVNISKTKLNVEVNLDNACNEFFCFFISFKYVYP